MLVVAVVVVVLAVVVVVVVGCWLLVVGRWLLFVFECYCFFLLIIIDEGAGDATVRFVLLKPALSEAVFKLLL